MRYPAIHVIDARLVLASVRWLQRESDHTLAWVHSYFPSFRECRNLGSENLPNWAYQSLVLIWTRLARRVAGLMFGCRERGFGNAGCPVSYVAVGVTWISA